MLNFRDTISDIMSSGEMKESVHSLRSKAHQQSFTGETRTDDSISHNVCFGVRPKHIVNRNSLPLA